MTAGKVVDLADGGAEIKEWCPECHTFLARHVYRRLANDPKEPDGPSSLIWEATELAPWLVGDGPGQYAQPTGRLGRRPRQSVGPIIRNRSHTPVWRVVLKCRCSERTTVYTPPR